VFALLAVFVFFAPIVSRTSLDRAAFELREIRQSISEETARFEELELEVARLSSPSRIAPLADALGMVLPTEVVRVEAPRIVRNQTDREERWAEMKSILTASP
jgi:cell division protein FtsL